jgi:hypothetical protein
VIAPPPGPPAPPALSAPSVSLGPSPRQRWPLAVIALSPLALAIFLLVVAPGFLDPMWDDRVAVAGFPLGSVLMALSVVLTIVAVVVATRVRSTLVAAIVTTLIAGAALWIVILGPAVVLIVIGLNSV